MLASISKWKADLLYELASLAMPAALAAQGTAAERSLEPELREYLEAQPRETGESPQPLPVQCERWLQSTISLSLRGLHQLMNLPSEVSDELLMQARTLLARAYSDLGHIYATTGRYTKAMTHAKQGIELFNATKDRLHTAKLQLWLCRLQLRLAIPQGGALPASTPTDDPDLLRGLLGSNAGEDTACAQASLALQKALKNLEGGEEEQSEQTKAVKLEIQVLLGRSWLRRGLASLVRSGPFCALSRLCQAESTLAGALELLRAPEPPEGLEETVRQAVDYILQASTSFREAGETFLGGLAHACLAAIYLASGRQDARLQRLVLSHCQHALKHLGSDEPTSEATARSGTVSSALKIGVRLFEAKALQRAGASKSGPAWVGDARAVDVLCEACLAAYAFCCAATASQELSHAVRRLSGDVEQGPAIFAYVKQEIPQVMHRLLRTQTEQQDGSSGQQLKALYCSLLTAWHTDAGQAEALAALRDHTGNLVAALGAS